MSEQKILCIYHSADFDGEFCHRIAKKFLPDGTEFIGWNFGDPTLSENLLGQRTIVVMDLPIDRIFGLQFKDGWICKDSEQIQPIDRWDSSNITWIDHHKSAIESHPKDIPGYRIDGVAACRLAWQWFNQSTPDNPTPKYGVEWPTKQDFIDRIVVEPLAVRLAGEYDIWDRRDPRAELFQHGLRSQELGEDEWTLLLSNPETHLQEYDIVDKLLRGGTVLQYARANEYRDVITSQGFDIEFEGIKFLACCSHEADIRSHLFEAGIKPHHEALFGFTWTGKTWRVSMYRIPGKDNVDILSIAKKFGGGGHTGACGCMMNKLPFLP